MKIMVVTTGGAKFWVRELIKKINDGNVGIDEIIYFVDRPLEPLLKGTVPKNEYDAEAVETLKALMQKYKVLVTLPINNVGMLNYLLDFSGLS